MSGDGLTIRQQIAALEQGLTPNERRITTVILADYPFAGLVGIQELSDHAQVSPASVTRLVHKLGCVGFAEFQRLLISELRHSPASPVDLKQSARALSAEGFYAEFLDRVGSGLDNLASTVSPTELDAVCTLLADPSRRIYVAGGRISGTLMSYLTLHLQQIRSGVFWLDTTPAAAADKILSIRRKDVVLIADLRRYQDSLLRLAEQIEAHSSPTTILITDRWISPIASHAQHIFAVPVETGTAWDTGVPVLALVEAMIIKLSESAWGTAHKRIVDWDRLRTALEAGTPDADTGDAG
ncbi:MurR/RpiR family transcriptional regulator [Hoeflea prorocentri]|uniref:MurR/RpiR family transcriptional regulator n=1 Tax=Hoeflea prorocentri TaxID=1922333 RepID=A0A9X3UJM3_9HYPH|nr:MurR/RpiR family transcriptional regulator [Hoeflea prorocentri]MCY6381802.1 MurR/RpiR family transcriptional regulator [Hoeflea prorocentri]MDA5399602.1 MurR/RpiR family transcriptional regulator [Hoeflea prorocentri]